METNEHETHIEFNKSNNCFKIVAVLMTNVICLGCGFEVTRIGEMKKLQPGQMIIFEGNPRGTNVLLKFIPYDLIESVSNNKWPKSIVFWEIPYSEKKTMRKKASNELCYQSEPSHMIQNSMIMSNFVFYFESIKDSIENKFGSQSQWPDTLNFARVIRNAFAHGGGIYFKERNHPMVFWKNYSYSYRDNGRQILPNDLNIPEIIFLLKEIDTYL
jgi:hypothetical protein